MSLDTQTIDKAVNKKYSEFSDAIKQELQAKMTSHSDAKQYASDYDKIQDMKTLFAQISSPQSEE